MIVDCYDPVNLFEMVPKLNLEMEPELAELDRLLEDDAICERVKKDSQRGIPTLQRAAGVPPLWRSSCACWYSSGSTASATSKPNG